MNLLSNIIFSVLFGVDRPLDEIFETHAEPTIAEEHSKVEAVSLLVEE